MNIYLCGDHTFRSSPSKSLVRPLSTPSTVTDSWRRAIRYLAVAEFTVSPMKTKKGGIIMTNDPTALVKALLITTTALGPVQCISAMAHAQTPDTNESPVATTAPSTQPPATIAKPSKVEDGTTAPDLGAQTTPQNSEPTAASQASSESKMIVVTGTHIRGGQSIGSNLQSIQSETIEKSGYATLHQFMQTYVQNFSGGVGEDLTGASNVSNATEASAINLRGLGPSATLVLLNGRRLPAAGTDASFTDISSIPITAIERVEILTDGGSAIYGTDAVAGVVNIILRKDFEGMETRLRYGTVTSGGMQEYLVSQIAGISWEKGNATVALEFNHQDPLGAEERSFTRELDRRPQGGTDRRVEYTNPGNILDPSTLLPAFAIPKNQDGRSLEPSDFVQGTVNLGNPYIQDDIIGRQRRFNGFLSLNHEITSDIKAFAEFRYGERHLRTKTGGRAEILFVPSTNAFFVDPFGDSPFLFIAYDIGEDLGPQLLTGEVKDYNAAAGATVDLAAALQFRFYGAYGEQDSKTRIHNDINRNRLSAFLADSNPNSAFNPFGEGSNTSPDTISALKSQRDFRMESKIKALNGVLDGDLLELPAGTLKFAVGGDYQDMDAGFDIFQDRSRTNRARFSRSVKAAFGELQVPVFEVAGGEADPLSLDISLAGRFDDYSDVGTTTNPRIAARLKLGDDIELRGNWGTAFRAPSLGNLSEANNSISAFSVSDPRLPNGSALIFYKAGENADLKNEKADTWSAGFSWRPLNGSFNLHINYFNIRFKDRIVPAPVPTDILTLPDQYGHLAVLNPSQEQLTAFCELPYRFFADPELCNNAGAIFALIDGRRQNLSKVYMQGIDLAGDIFFDLSSDVALNLNLNSSYIIDYKERAAPGTPKVEKVDTVGFPADLRLQAIASLTYRTSATFAVTANYIDSYKDETNSPFLSVDDWLTFDLNFSLNIGNEHKIGILRNASLSFSVVNVLADAPPFVNGVRYAYDPANADPVGRLISISLQKQW